MHNRNSFSIGNQKLLNNISTIYYILLYFFSWKQNIITRIHLCTKTTNKVYDLLISKGDNPLIIFPYFPNFYLSSHWMTHFSVIIRSATEDRISTDSWCGLDLDEWEWFAIFGSFSTFRGWTSLNRLLALHPSCRARDWRFSVS